ncbi:MAG: N-acetylmuramoyl-L-alanine amidase [Alphaproteobacteria bacterium]|nr:N-acetylmuramoyl-L-alanine amidase [Alphaproteobacteria bacterium]
MKMLYKIRGFISILVFFLSLFISGSQAYGANTIYDIRTGDQPDGVRLVIDGSNEFKYDAFLLDNPNRLVIDVKDAKIPDKFNVSKNHIIEDVRFGDLNNGGKRIVFVLKKNANIKKKFTLEPSGEQKKWRLVVDLNVGGESISPVVSQSKVVAQNTGYDKKNVSVVKTKKVVVLDPGHGGKDPGAIGRSFKTYEKTLTLAMGKELKRHLEARGYKVYLTRTTDIFIPLRRRVQIARSYHADLFISIHADSTVNRKAQGFSIYTLSETASDKEAEALAERENKADIIDGMDFSDNSPEINDVLISLSQNDCRNKSSKFATYVVNEVRRNVKLVNNAHKFAGFAVLKAPDVPSVLLEMGYLSNYTEEKQLRQPQYRSKLAQYMAKAVDRYFSDPEIVI